LNRTVALFPGCSTTASTVLVLFAFFVAGCSGSSRGNGTAADAGFFAESELRAIRKSAKRPKDFVKSVQKRVLESDGVVIPEQTSGKTKIPSDH
jgi:hypothetical protein